MTVSARYDQADIEELIKRDLNSKGLLAEKISFKYCPGQGNLNPPSMSAEVDAKLPAGKD